MRKFLYLCLLGTVLAGAVSVSGWAAIKYGTGSTLFGNAGISLSNGKIKVSGKDGLLGNKASGSWDIFGGKASGSAKLAGQKYSAKTGSSNKKSSGNSSAGGAELFGGGSSGSTTRTSGEWTITTGADGIPKMTKISTSGGTGTGAKVSVGTGTGSTGTGVSAAVKPSVGEFNADGSGVWNGSGWDPTGSSPVKLSVGDYGGPAVPSVPSGSSIVKPSVGEFNADGSGVWNGTGWDPTGSSPVNLSAGDYGGPAVPSVPSGSSIVQPSVGEFNADGSGVWNGSGWDPTGSGPVNLSAGDYGASGLGGAGSVNLSNVYPSRVDAIQAGLDSVGGKIVDVASDGSTFTVEIDGETMTLTNEEMNGFIPAGSSYQGEDLEGFSKVYYDQDGNPVAGVNADGETVVLIDGKGQTTPSAIEQQVDSNTMTAEQEVEAAAAGAVTGIDKAIIFNVGEYVLQALEAAEAQNQDDATKETTVTGAQKFRDSQGDECGPSTGSDTSLDATTISSAATTMVTLLRNNPMNLAYLDEANCVSIEADKDTTTVQECLRGYRKLFANTVALSGQMISEGSNAISSKFYERAETFANANNGLGTGSLGAMSVINDAERYPYFEMVRGTALSAVQLGVKEAGTLFELDILEKEAENAQ